MVEVHEFIKSNQHKVKAVVHDDGTQEDYKLYQKMNAQYIIIL